MSRAQKSDELNAAPARPPRRWRRFAGVALLLGVALAIALAVLSADRVERYLQHKIEIEFSEATGGTLTMEQLDIRWLRPGIEVVGLRMDIPALDSAPPFWLEIERGRFDLAYRGLAALPAGRFHLARLEVEGVRCSLDQEFVESRRTDDDDSGRPPFDLRVDRLRIRDGEFHYADRSLPIDVDARDAHLRASWNAYRRTLVGEISASADLATTLFDRPLPVSARASFRVSEARLVLFDGVATAPGVELDLEDQTISWDDRTFVTAEGAFRADLEEVARWLDGEIPGLSGAASGRIVVSRTDGPVQVRGDVRLEDFSLWRIRASTASVAVAVDPDVVVVDLEQATTLGGSVRGRLAVGIGANRTVEARLAGERLTTSSILSLVGIPLPLAGRGPAEIRFAGDPADPASWEAEGTFDVSAGTEIAGRIGVDGSGTVGIADGRVVVRVPDASAAASSINVRVEHDLTAGGGGRISLSGRTGDARETQRAAMLVLDSVDVSLPERLHAPLEGSGSVSCDVTLAEGANRAAISLDLDDGAWDGEAFDRMAVDVVVDERRIAIPRAEVVGQDWIARAALEIDPAEPTLLEADVEMVAVPVDVLARVSGMTLPTVEGTIDAAATLRAADRGLEGSGRLRLRNVSWEGETLDEIEAAFVAYEDRAVFTDLFARGPAIELLGELEVRIADRIALLDISDSSVDLGSLNAVRSIAPEVDARLGVRGSLVIEVDRMTGELDLTGDDWRILDRDLPALDGRVELAADGCTVRLTAREDDSWSIAGAVGWSEGLPLEARIRVNRLGLDVVTDPTAPSAWARVTGVVDAAGPLMEPGELTASGTLEQMDIRVGTRTLRTEHAIPLRYEGGAFTIGPFGLSGPNSDLEVRLAIQADERTLDGRLSGEVDLGVANAVVSSVSASGRLDVDARVSGPIDDPHLEGDLRVERGRLSFLGFDQPFEAVRLDASLAGDEIEIREVAAILGGGELRGRGGILLEGFGVDSYRLELDGANVRVSYPEHFRGVYEGRLVLRGDSTAAELGGPVRMLRGEYTQPIEVGSLITSGSREYSSSEELDLPARIYLDVDLAADGNVWARNDLVQAESNFDLNIGGDLRKPEVVGRLRVFEGGRLRFRDIDYRIESATLDFVELDRIDPLINLRATTNVEQYQIQLRIEGKIDRFDYELTSTPALSQPDIIALLTTGKTLQELTAQGAGASDITGDLAASYFAGALTDRFERELRDVLRVERFQISPVLVRGSGDATARLTIGKEVADDLFLIYSQEFGSSTENQLYQVEWRASRRFSLTAERDTLGGIGGEVLYANHYWWRLPPIDYGMPIRSRTWDPVPTGVEFVGDVRIVGVDEAQMGEVRGRIPLEHGDAYRRSALFEGAQQIREWFVERRRIEARVDVDAVERVDDPGIYDVTYSVDPGPVVLVDVLGVSGRERRRILKRLQSRWADTAFVDVLRADAVDEILRYYHDKGHYAADVVADHGASANGERTLVFEVDPGPRVLVDSIDIRGNSAIVDDRIQRQMLTRESGTMKRRVLVPSTLADDVRAIRNLYRDQGFLRVRVERPVIRLAFDGATAGIVLEIAEGPRARIADVRLIDPPAEFDESELVAWSGVVAGEVFAPRKLIDAEAALRRQVDRQGYPDARVEARAVPSEEEDVVFVEIRVTPGPLRIASEIELSGNFTTKDYIVRRELTLAPGDPISRAEILRSQQALYRLGIFRNVRIRYRPTGETDPSAHILTVEVEEAPPFGITLGAGYDSEAKLKASFGASHGNVGGRDRTVSIQGRVSSIQERIQAIVEEPRLFARPVTALFSILQDHREQPEFTEDRRAIAFRVDKRLNERWLTFARYNFQRVDLSDVQENASDTLQDQKLEDLILGDVGVTAVRGTLDDPFVPTRGNRTTVGARWFDEVFLSEADFVQLIGQFTWTRTLANEQSLSGAVRTGASFPYGSTVQVPLSERFFAGGDSTIRGFTRDAVEPAGGEGLFILNQEWRVPIWKSLRGILFYDAGNVYSEASDIDLLDLRHVLGIGIRLETPIGPLRLEYGRKLDRREGESSGELFIAIGNPF